MKFHVEAFDVESEQEVQPSRNGTFQPPLGGRVRLHHDTVVAFLP
jgi:hypothetical protein